MVLRGRLQSAIDRNNPEIPLEARQEALKNIERIATPDLMVNNQAFHEMVTEGFPVTYRKDGVERGDRVQLVNLEIPEQNDFLVVSQFTIIENNTNKRPYLILFVNGLPLVLFELKNAIDEHATLESAYHQIQTYKEAIPSLFIYNTFCVLSDGADAKAGSLSPEYPYNGRGFLSYPDGEILEGIFQDGQYCGKDQDFVNEVGANEGGICEKSRINISYLFFDTETTGLPKDYDGPVTDLNNWPRLVQLAYIAFDRDGNIIAEENFIVQPDGFSIPKDATKVHGITTAVAKKEGIPLDTVLEIFSSLVEEADYLVAHNIAFDEKIIGAEFIRNGMENSISFKRKICTMKSTKDYCAINGPYGFKWPTLSELYYKLFGTNFDEAHNAAADIEATAECFWELRSRKLI